MTRGSKRPLEEPLEEPPRPKFDSMQLERKLPTRKPLAPPPKPPREELVGEEEYYGILSPYFI